MALQLQAVVALDHSRFGSGLSTIGKLTSNVTGAMSLAFGGVAGEIFAMGRAFGPVGVAIGALKQSISVGASFEQQMANVASVTGLAGKELDRVAVAARNMAKETKFTATEAATALYSLGSAGISTADGLINTLQPSLLLAGATLSDTSLATETLTAALAAFSLPASEATDIANQLAGAIASSPANMARIADGMKAAGPAAASLGISLKKAVAELAMFNLVGLRGEMAGQAFRQVLTKLKNEAKDSAGVIGAALKGWDASTEGITGAVRRLNAAGVTSEFVFTELGQRAGPALALLMKKGADSMDNLADKITDAANVQKIYNKQMDTLTGKFSIFKSAIEEIFQVLFTKMSPALQEATDNMAKMANAVSILIKAMLAGDWSKVKTMLADVFDSALAAAKLAFDGILEAVKKIPAGFDKAIEKVRTFGKSLLENIGLPATFARLSGALDSLKVTFGHVADGAQALFKVFGNVNWSTAQSSAIKTLDAALSAVISTFDLVVKGINGLVSAIKALKAGWDSLDSGSKIIIATFAGSFSILTAIQAVDVAMTAMATKAIPMLIARVVALKATIAGVLTVVNLAIAGAAAFGVALGLLIRQIPGVADALDNLTIKVGQFLRAVEKEDMVLKANGERLAKLRQENSDLIIAQEKARQSTEAAMRAADDHADALNAQEDAAAEARNALIAATRATDGYAATVKTNSSFMDAFTGKQSTATKATLNQIIAMRSFAPASADMGIGLNDMAESMATATPAAEKMATATETIKVSVTDLVGMLAAFKGSKVSVFDVSNFIDAMKQLEKGLKGFTLPEIKLPDFSKFKIPRIHGLEMSTFITAMQTLAKGLEKVSFGDINIPDFSAIKIPNISGHAVDKFLKQMKNLKDGMLNLDFGEIGKMDINIKGDSTGASTSLAEILGLLKAAKGVIWA